MILKKTWPRMREALIHGNQRWIVDPRPVEKRSYHESDEAAKAEVKRLRTLYQNKSADALSQRQHNDVVGASAILQAHSVSLTRAAEFFVASRKKDAELNSPIVSLCCQEWVAVKEKKLERGERRRRTIKELQMMANKFTKRWGERKPHTIDAGEISKWLDALDCANQTRINVRTKLSQFFRFCRVRGYVPSNPCEIIEPDDPGDVEVEIFQPHECISLIKDANRSKLRRWALPYVLIGLFAGPRPGEEEGLEWEDFKDYEIKIRRETSKTRKTRYIRCDKRLWKVLMKLKGHQTGRIVGRGWRKKWDYVRAEAGFSFKTLKEKFPESKKTWPDNVLRHSFASHWLPIHQDKPRLAELMGNSVPVINKDYNFPIPLSQAKQYDAILGWVLKDVVRR